MGIEEPVNSPTFTILQIYEEGRLPLYHFDVYRIEEARGDGRDRGWDEYIDGDGVCLIEWAGRIEDSSRRMSLSYLSRRILKKGLDYRRITVRRVE